jgi:hypothetical protein
MVKMSASEMGQQEQQKRVERWSAGAQQYGALREVAWNVEAPPDLAQSERRFRRNTYIVIAFLLVNGLTWFDWRMALGILLGGALSVFNERWLRASASVMLGTAARARTQRVPRWTAAKFILRYFVLAIVAGVAVWSGFFDLLGIGIGLASFVGAVMVEAGYQLYLTFKTSDS